MTTQAWINIAIVASLWILFFHTWAIEKKLRKELEVARLLISEETKRKEAHTEAFKQLTDTEAIEADFERGAQAAEMRAANRKTLPREDAGRHARIRTARVRKA